MYPRFSGVRLFLLQALMHPGEIHDAPTLSARVPLKSPRPVEVRTTARRLPRTVVLRVLNAVGDNYRERSTPRRQSGGQLR